MGRAKSKTFVLSGPFHLFNVDRWWAGLLAQGPKEIVGVEWEALGQMKWRLRVLWQPVESDLKLNVGHPEYADYSTEDLNVLLYDALSSFETAFTDLNLLEQKVEAWELEETTPHGKKDPLLAFRADLPDVDRLIAIEYVWPAYKELQKVCRFLAVQMREVEAEVKAREDAEYFAVRVDRGMLRSTYTDQIGYDNDFLFEEVEFFPPDIAD